MRNNIDLVLSTNAHKRSQADWKAHTSSLALTSAPRLIIHSTKSRRSFCASRMRTVSLNLHEQYQPTTSSRFHNTYPHLASGTHGTILTQCMLNCCFSVQAATLCDIHQRPALNPNTVWSIAHP